MTRLVLYTARQEDGKRLLHTIRDQAARDWSLELDYQVFVRRDKAAEYLRRCGAEAIVWDMSDAADRKAFIEVRPFCADAFLLVLAARETSPLAFLTPAIAPSSLIIQPLSAPELERAAQEILTSIRRRKKRTEGCFIIEYRDRQERIPYKDIYYFEARGRKLYARLRGEEVGFSGTLDQLETQLPKSFQRCHRSYIVNTDMIEQVALSQGQIILWDGLSVLLSRSYKKTIRELGGQQHEDGDS